MQAFESAWDVCCRLRRANVLMGNGRLLQQPTGIGAEGKSAAARQSPAADRFVGCYAVFASCRRACPVKLKNQEMQKPGAWKTTSRAPGRNACSKQPMGALVFVRIKGRNLERLELNFVSNIRRVSASDKIYASLIRCTSHTTHAQNNARAMLGPFHHWDERAPLTSAYQARCQP